MSPETQRQPDDHLRDFARYVQDRVNQLNGAQRREVRLSVDDLLSQLDDVQQIKLDASRLNEWPTRRRILDSALKRLEALERSPSLEVRRRIEGLLAGMSVPVQRERMRTLRSILVLERIGGREARAILADLGGGRPDAPETRAARQALDRLNSAHAGR
jgi:hypothetical protein